MSDDFWKEVFDLVRECDSQRPKVVKEFRLYYNTDGTIIGLWENSFPEGTNFIVLDDPGMFYNSNSHWLRVRDNKLILLNLRAPLRTRLKKSNQGFRVVKGNAALILEANEDYLEIEYYDKTDN